MTCLPKNCCDCNYSEHRTKAVDGYKSFASWFRCSKLQIKIDSDKLSEERLRTCPLVEGEYESTILRGLA